MGILAFLGLRPLPPSEPEPPGEEMQDLGLDDAGAQLLADAQRAVEEASIHDHDEAIALLSRAAQGLRGVARQNHPRVAELRQEIEEALVERATTFRAAAEADAGRWGAEWTACATAPSDDDEGARDERFARIGALVEALRAGLKRHDAAVQRLRGTPAEAGMAEVQAVLGEARAILEQATAALQQLDAARRQAARLEALRHARERCRQACTDASGPAGAKAFAQLKGEVDDIAEELVTPTELEPAQAAREAERLIGELDTLRLRVVREHNAELKAELAGRLKELQTSMQRAGIELDRGALQRLEGELAALDARDTIDPTNALRMAMERFEGDVHYAERAQETQRGKLPVIAEAQKRHAGVPIAKPLDELIQRMVPGRMGMLDPGPLGQADPNYDGSTWPEVKLLPPNANGKVCFAPTQASEGGAHTCTITPFGEHDIGVIELVDGTSVSTMIGGQLQTFRSIAGAKKAWKGRMLRRGVTPQGYQQIELRELEHLVDFSYAFQIAAVRLAAAVNAVSGREFANAEAALTALIDSLGGDARTLVPEDPRDPRAWDLRVRRVTNLLAGFSTDRDKRGTHSPAGNVARESSGAIVIEPEFKTESLHTAEIISLARVDPVFSGLAPAQGAGTWVLKSTRRTKKKVAVDPFRAVGGEGFASDTVQTGTVVTIESAESGGKIWVSAPAGSVGALSGCYGLKDATPVYFQLRIDNLE